jgi:hypothetical protein
MGYLTCEHSRVLTEIAAERERQDAKWGEQNHPDGTGEIGWPEHIMPGMGWSINMTPAEHVAKLARRHCQQEAKQGKTTWLGIALEEVAEAFAESDPEKLRAELVQTAAVLVAWAEAIDRRSDALRIGEPIGEHHQ